MILRRRAPGTRNSTSCGSCCAAEISLEDIFNSGELENTYDEEVLEQVEIECMKDISETE